MKLLTLLWLVVCLMVGLSVSTATAGVMFLFVCEEPADCGGDGNFQFFLELDASVIKPNGGYSTGSDGGAGFVGWRASSKTGNGFVAHGDIGHIVGAEPHMGITFDSQGVINGLYSTEVATNEPPFSGGGDKLEFSVVGSGKIVWAEPDRVEIRADQGCPPDPSGLFCINKTPVRGSWRRAATPGN